MLHRLINMSYYVVIYSCCFVWHNIFLQLMFWLELNKHNNTNLNSVTCQQKIIRHLKVGTAYITISDTVAMWKAKVSVTKTALVQRIDGPGYRTMNKLQSTQHSAHLCHSLGYAAHLQNSLKILQKNFQIQIQELWIRIKNLIDWSLGHIPPLQKFQRTPIVTFPGILHTESNRHTDGYKNITSTAQVITGSREINDTKPGWWASVNHWEQRRGDPSASADTAAENWVSQEQSDITQQTNPSSAACVARSEDCSDLRYTNTRYTRLLYGGPGYNWDGWLSTVRYTIFYPAWDSKC